MNEKKICFIMCSNDEVLASECIRYIERLEVPEEFEIEVLVVGDAISMASGYNKGMKQSDAKYKVYLHQDVLLIQKDFLNHVLSIFQRHPEVGMMGVVGNTSIAKDGGAWSDGMQRRIGRTIVDYVMGISNYEFQNIDGEFQEVVILDGLLMITQYDILWREDLFCGWDFYDCSQSMEFWSAGYKVVVPQMSEPWCLHDNDILNLADYDKWREVFRNEYEEDYTRWNAVTSLENERK